MIFNGYNPYGPHSKPANDVPRHVLKAAKDLGASHLSADGQRVYCTRYGQVLMAKWDKWAGFGAWQEVNELPSDAVVIE